MIWGLRTICCPLYEHLLGILVLGAGGISEDPVYADGDR